MIIMNNYTIPGFEHDNAHAQTQVIDHNATQVLHNGDNQETLLLHNEDDVDFYISDETIDEMHRERPSVVATVIQKVRKRPVIWVFIFGFFGFLTGALFGATYSVPILNIITMVLFFSVALMQQYALWRTLRKYVIKF